ELADDPTVTAWDVDVVEAVRRAKELAAGGDVQIISADIARQALEHDLVDELQCFSAPVMLGDGVRVLDVPGGRLVEWELVGPIVGAEAAFGRIYRPRRPRLPVKPACSATAPDLRAAGEAQHGLRRLSSAAPAHASGTAHASGPAPRRDTGPQAVPRRRISGRSRSRSGCPRSNARRRAAWSRRRR